MQKIHKYLLAHSALYAKWHKKTNHNQYHLIILVLVGIGLASSMLFVINQGDKVSVNTTGAAIGPSLALSPSTIALVKGQNIAVNILLDTANQQAAGVDIYYLHYNPTILQVMDDDTSVAGVQITPGTLFALTVANSANQNNGTIQFSQVSSGGSYFTGAGTLATVHFLAINAGTSPLTLDFAPGVTTDSNISYLSLDLLSAVSNASVSVNSPDTAPPAITLTSPNSGSTVSGALTVSANATDNVAVAGVQFKLDGANLSAEDTSAPYSVAWDTSTVANGSHTLTATARDNAGNTATASAVTVTVANAIGNTDAIPPTLAITNPKNATKITGANVTISVAATDNVKVTKVLISLDGKLLVSDTSTPYSYKWNTKKTAAGLHTITAQAFDAAGNSATASITVTK